MGKSGPSLPSPSALILALLLFGSALLSQSAPEVTVIRAGLLIDGTGNPPRSDVQIVVEKGRILDVGPRPSIPPGARVLDASGQVVIPGLIDTHVHLGEQAIIRNPSGYRDQVDLHLRQNLAFGVTAVFGLGLDQDLDFIFRLRERSWSEGFDGPRILSAGRGFTAVGGHPAHIIKGVPNQVDDPEEAKKRVAELSSRRPDGIKIWYARMPGRDDLPTIRTEVARAIIQEAHRHDLPVIAHLSTAEDTRTLLLAGLDRVTHISRDPYPEETVALLAQRGVMLAPTLVQRHKAALFYGTGTLEEPLVQAVLGREARDLRERVTGLSRDTLKGMEDSYRQALRNVRQLREGGVGLALGTDAGTNYAPMGLVAHLELAAFVEAGLSPLEALTVGTRDSARWAGVLDEIGTLEPGKRADLIILDENPLEKIANTRTIDRILLGGRWVDPLQLTAGSGR